MNCLRITRRHRYSWLNGVRSVSQNTERAQDVNLEVHAIRRQRRAPAEILAERRERAERFEAERIVALQLAVEREARIAAEWEAEIRQAAEELFAADIAQARVDVLRAERLAMDGEAAIQEAIRMAADQEVLIRAAAAQLAADQVAAAKADANRAEQIAIVRENAMRDAERVADELNEAIRAGREREEAMHLIAEHQICNRPHNDIEDDVEIVMPPPVIAISIQLNTNNLMDGKPNIPLIKTTAWILNVLEYFFSSCVERRGDDIYRIAFHNAAPRQNNM